MTDISERPVNTGTAPLENGTFVRCVNVGLTELRWQWDSRWYALPVGVDAFVPFECMKLYLGDPRAGSNVASIKDDRGLVSFVADRATEVRRLRCLYDHPFGDETKLDPKLIPQVHVYGITGEPITTVLDDPEGREIVPAATTMAESDALRAVVQHQGKMIEALMKNSGIRPVPGIGGADPIGMQDPSQSQVEVDTTQPPPKMMRYDISKDRFEYPGEHEDTPGDDAPDLSDDIPEDPLT